MTEYEYSILIAEYNATAGFYFSIVLSVVSAFLIVAYTVGKKLTYSETVIISGIYILSVSLLIFGAVAHLNNALYYAKGIQTLNPQSPHGINDAAVIAIAVAMIGAVLASLKFMWDVRHPKKKK